MIEKLMLFGLTRQEATIYICLYQTGPLTGYEVAKDTGISRSNVYSALAGLVEKGAAYKMEAAANKYLAAPVEELCENRMRLLKEAEGYLKNNLLPVEEETEGYITIEGYRHIQDKVYAMLQKAEKRIYLSLSAPELVFWKEELQKLVLRQIKVVILTDEQVELSAGITTYLSDRKEAQIHLIVDSKLVLTGDYSGQESDTCLYSGQKNLVSVLKEALRNEIRLTNVIDQQKQTASV